MNLVPSKITQSMGTKVLLAKKNSPQAFFAAGIVGVVGGTVMACRATLRLEDTLADIRQDIEIVREAERRAVGDGLDEELVGDATNKTLTTIYIKGGLELGKLYGPSVLVMSASIAALTGSHVTLTKRNAGLTAAYAVMDRGLKEYRERVREELGEDKERDIYRAVEVCEIDDGDGNKTKEYRLPPVHGLSPYARFFDESSSEWQRNAHYNRAYVSSQEGWANDKLQAQGYLFLNDVYRGLGLPETPEGQMVGWLLHGDGDGRVDFDLANPRNDDFYNGPEQSVLLDFNVDGVIYDLIGRAK